MTPEPSHRSQLGRTIARIGLGLAIGLAILNLTFLALNLLPEIFPMLYSVP